MDIGARVQWHKSKLKTETNDDNLRNIQKLGTPENHRSMTSHFNIIKKCVQKISKKGDVYYDKQTDSAKNP